MPTGNVGVMLNCNKEENPSLGNIENVQKKAKPVNTRDFTPFQSFTLDERTDLTNGCIGFLTKTKTIIDWLLVRAALENGEINL